MNKIWEEGYRGKQPQSRNWKSIRTSKGVGATYENNCIELFVTHVLCSTHVLDMYVWLFVFLWLFLDTIVSLKSTLVSRSGKPRVMILGVQPDVCRRHTSKKRKSLRSLLPSPKYFAEKLHKFWQQNLATKVRKSWSEAKIYKNVGSLTTKTCSLDIYGVSSRHLTHI